MPAQYPDLICTPELSDAATITGAATSGELTLQNLKDGDPDLLTRFADLGNMYVEIDLGDTYDVDYFWLRSPDITYVGTIRWRMSDISMAAVVSAPTYDSGIIPYVGFSLLPGESVPKIMSWPYKDHHLDLRNNPQSVRWIRFDLLDPDNEDTFGAGVALSRLYISLALRPPYGLIIQDGGPIQTPTIIESQGGSRHTVHRPVRNEYTIAARGLTKAQIYGDYFELARSRSVDKDILLVMDDDPFYRPQRTVYGLLGESFKHTNEDKANYEFVMRVTDLSDMGD